MILICDTYEIRLLVKESLFIKREKPILNCTIKNLIFPATEFNFVGFFCVKKYSFEVKSTNIVNIVLFSTSQIVDIFYNAPKCCI